MSLLKQALASVGNEADKSGLGGTADVETTILLSESLEQTADATAEMEEVNLTQQVHEELQTQFNNLSRIAEDIELVARDGLTTREAALIQSQINSYNADVPASLQVNIPSNESFTAASRVTQTQVGTEAIKDKAKDLAKWIGEMLTKAIEQIQKWANKFFGGAERLKKWAEATGKKADGFEQSDAKKKVTVSTKLLSKGTTVPSTSSVPGDYLEFAGKASLIDAEYGLEKKAFDEAVKAAEEDDAAKIITAISDDGEYGKAKKALEGASPVAENSLIGGKHIKVTEGKRNVESDDVKISKDEVEIQILSPSDVVKITEKMSEAMDIVIDSKKLYGANKKVKDDAVKAAKSLDKVLNDDDTGSDQKGKLRELSRALSTHSMRMVSGGVHVKWASHVVSVSQAVAGYCNKSLA